MKRVFRIRSEGTAKIVFLDSFASTYAKGFRVLPYVDLSLHFSTPQW